MVARRAVVVASTVVRTVALCLLVVVAIVGCTPAPPVNRPPRIERPEPPPVDPIQQYADDRLGVMTLEEKIASLLMLHLPGTDPAALGSFSRTFKVGGLILMGDNIPEPEGQLAAIIPALSADPGLPILIAIDQEGGTVRRMGSDKWASAERLRYLPPGAAREAFSARSTLLKSVGISVNLGVVADVTGDRYSFIFDRSMGSTGAEAAPRVGEAVAGERGMVLSTLKHFPGHGATPGDSHSSIPTTAMGYDEWRAEHAPPFEAGIAAGAEFVMFGHLQFDAIDPVPASLSVRWHQILRDDLGFSGVTITDDMLMLQRSGRPEYANPSENAILALAAGNTMLLYVGGIDSATLVADISAAVTGGRISAESIDQSARKLLVLRRELSGQTGRFVHCFDECLAMIE